MIGGHYGSEQRENDINLSENWMMTI